MTPEQQRIAIAEACPDIFDIICPDEPATIVWRRDGELVEILEDLNAMHEAVETLADKVSWANELYAICRQNHHGKDVAMSLATAPQCAEAFLKTLNLWKP